MLADHLAAAIALARAMDGTSAADIETMGSSKAGNGILILLARENRV
jgi:hypothetical protein